MPGFDQTGPTGQGSLTGRRMGRCTNYGAKFKNQSSENSETAIKQPENIQVFGSDQKRGCGKGRQNRYRGGV